MSSLTLLPRRAVRTIPARCFKSPGARKAFVALEHSDPVYVYFFGQLLLCFSFEHEGQRHECCFVEYVWPGRTGLRSREDDGVPHLTEYFHVSRKLYEVRPVEQVLFCPLLFDPPMLHSPRRNTDPSYFLDEDNLGNF